MAHTTMLFGEINEMEKSKRNTLEEMIQEKEGDRNTGNYSKDLEYILLERNIE